MRVHFDTGQADRLAVDMEKVPGKVVPFVSKAIRKTALDVELDAKRLVPVDTGNLKNSISTTTHLLEAVIGPTADYGDEVENGVPHPWIIRPRRPGGWLHWIGKDGEDHFARQVVHPPMAPRPYMRPAFDRNVPRLVDAIEQIASRIL